MNYRLYFLSIACLVFLLSSCKTVTTDHPDEILGLPPTEREDPFFFVTLPAEAEEAKASGRIGGDSGDAKTTSTEPQTKIQCFSCVKICESEACEDADSICGWGVDYDKENAMLRANAECEGALNLARNNPQWKRVTGNCPIATCQ